MVDASLIALQPGTVVAGRYEIIKCLGTGSMGVVYACRHRELSGHNVAIKVLFPEVAQDEVSSARFRNEIFASYGVSHPNVVRAYEYIRDGDIIAYTMEYVEGGDLADRLNLRKSIAINEIVDILTQMCSGVQAIHDAGIVHRDLKPENILLRKDGIVKIADFGIARTGNGPKLTEHGGVVGTIDYVSPEYILESQVDWRSDIYAMGILAYEMVTGQSPFRADSVYATMTMRLKTDPQAPSRIRPDCPQELDRIILRAMARKPEERYQSALEMFNDLIKLNPQPKLAHVAPIITKQNNTFTKSAFEPEERSQSQGAYFGSAKRPSSSTEIINRNAIFANQASEGPSIMLGSSGNDSTLIEDTIISVTPDYVPDDPISAPINNSYYGEERMAPLLSRGVNTKTIGSRSFSNSDRPVLMSSAHSNKQRLQQLHESSKRHKQSYWIEILSILLAMVVGIAAGLYFMENYIFNKNSQKVFENENTKVKELDDQVG